MHSMDAYVIQYILDQTSSHITKKTTTLRSLHEAHKTIYLFGVYEVHLYPTDDIALINKKYQNAMEIT